MSHRYGPDIQGEGFMSGPTREAILRHNPSSGPGYVPIQATRSEYTTAPPNGTHSGYMNISSGPGHFSTPALAPISSPSSSVPSYLPAPPSSHGFMAENPGYLAGIPAYYSHPPVSRDSPIDSRACQLHVQQQPKEACLAFKDKEKMRKPIDPPPMVQLTIDAAADPQQQFLQNPHLFICATLYKGEQDEPYGDNRSLTGTITSSLHRLKGLDNKDGAWFIFPDISVMALGSFRLCFSLYEYLPGAHLVRHLSSQLSQPFEVVLPKDFRGLEESTMLTRSFSEQGVRLRLRKETRGLMNGKRRSSGDQLPISITPVRPVMEQHLAKKSKQELPAPPGLPTMSNIAYEPTPHSQLRGRTSYGIAEGYVENTPSSSTSIYGGSIGSYNSAPYATPYTGFSGSSGSLMDSHYHSRRISAPALDNPVFPQQHFSTIAGTSPYTG